MEKKEPNSLNLASSGKQNNKELKNGNFKINLKPHKIKPRNIFNNNKLFAYQKASGNITLLKKLMHQVFVDKYYHDKNFYNAKVIGDIINNESTHLVAEFKDYLIYGDDSEFLQKNYNIKDCKKYLPRIFNYYESCSIIFPNYVVLHESKYIYKNIQKKQRIIDIQQEREEKLKTIKSGSNNGKELNGEKNEENNLFNTNAIYSILGQTNTSNINKLFGIYNENENKKEDENSQSIFNNIINEFDKVEEKNFLKKKMNLIKKKCRIQSLILNNSKSIIKQNNIQINDKEQINNDKKDNKYYKKKPYVIINKKQNNKYLNHMEKNNTNIKYLFIKKKTNSKIDEDKNTLNISKKVKNQKNIKENKNFLTNENTTTNIFSKIPKSKLSMDFGGAKKHHKIKTTLNEHDIMSQKGISFFKDILNTKKLRRKNTKNNTSMGKSSSKTKNKENSFIPSQKQFLQIMKKDIFAYKMKKNIEKKLNQINYSSSPSFIKNKKNKKSNISWSKVPNIYIKDSNSTTNLIKNENSNLTDRSKLAFKNRKGKKGNTHDRENDNNYNENLTNNKELTSESNLNIDINTIPLTDREIDTKKIYFTIAPQINNMINLNKIKYMIKNSSKENVVKGFNNNIKSYKSCKYSKNVSSKKNTIINKKNAHINKNTYKNKKKSFSFKSSYKNSNTQVSSSLLTAACSFGKNSHLVDFETIKVYSKRKLPYPILFKAKSINEKNKNKHNMILERKFSLSPDKIESKNIIKKMLINNSISTCNNCNKCLNNNNILNKKVPKNIQIKKQKSKIFPIRKEKDSIDIKIKDMISSILNNKNMSNTFGNISRNLNIKHPINEKSLMALTNRSNNSITTNGSTKKPLLSIKALKNISSSSQNQIYYPCNKTYND